MNFVFRNSMLEIFFPEDKYVLSDYDSPLSTIDADNYIWMNFLKPSPNENEILEQVLELNNNLDLSIKSSNNKPIYILGLFTPCLYSSVVNNDQEVYDEIYKFNKKIYELSIEFNNIHYLNPNHLINFIGENYFSSKFYFSSSSVISPTCSKGFKLWLESIEIQILKERKKLLILDLDNTLWGGVLGEDGYSGIQIGKSYPGNVYEYMQKKIKQLSSTGIILAICSKNNIDDVIEGFKKNKNMHLNLDDFSIIKANWEEKSSNIRNIISEINIGEDACVFIDDNPLERDLVKNNFPKMIVPDFPESHYNIPKFINLLSLKYFSSKTLTNEDVDKKLQYKIKLQADKDKLESSTKDEFLKNLSLKGYIYNNTLAHIGRISQMTLKTNQFNLTTIRLDEEAIKNAIESGDYIFPMHVKDKYGDHGITALIIASKSLKPREIDITTFLPS